MGKLFNLKQWLTVDDAAKHLSIVFGEDVAVADVFQLALDRELTLSVHFVNGGHARPGVLVPIGEATYEEVVIFPGSEPLRLYGGPPISTDGVESHILQLEKYVAELTGVWDLPMIGGERIAVEQMYQRLTGGPDATNVPMDGAFVQSTDEQLCQLQDDYDDNEYSTGSTASLERIKRYIKAKKINAADAEKLLNQHKEDRKKFLEDRKSKPQTESFYPGGGLPQDAVFVVRIDALLDLEKTANGESDSAGKPLTTRERDTLLTIIAVLAKAAKVPLDDYSKPGKAAGYIEGLTDEFGAHVSKRAIEEHLKKIPDALATRKK